MRLSEKTKLRDYGVDEKLPSEIIDSLITMGFMHEGEVIDYQVLTGGIASDIWRIDIYPTEDGGCTVADEKHKTLCIKRALSQLKVKQTWEVSTDRNAYEVLWFQTVAEYFSHDVVPCILAHDKKRGVFAMDFLPPENYPVWKNQLRDGDVNPLTAKLIASYLGKIHQRSALPSQRAKLIQQFDTLHLFYQIRIEPYFLATAKKHPDLNNRIENLANTLARTQTALVHGDISPKNILVGEAGPIILDAECAVYGDPAFDIAFLLNHLLLKSVWRPLLVDQLLQSFTVAYDAYLLHVDWEDISTFEERACAFLGVFLLARIDGKSPVEYITEEKDKAFVRSIGRTILEEKLLKFSEIGALWKNKHKGEN